MSLFLAGASPKADFKEFYGGLLKAKAGTFMLSPLGVAAELLT
jgi:hypothetical protein